MSGRARVTTRVEAVILAAGYNRQVDGVVGLLSLGKETILQRLVRQLSAANVARIVVVTGCRGEEVRRHISGRRVVCVENPDYATTLTARSLALGLRKTTAPRVLCVDGDLVLEDGLFERILATPAPVLAIDTRRVLGYLDDKVRIEKGRVTEIGKAVERPTGESVGIMCLNRAGVARFAWARADGYYEDVIASSLKNVRWSCVDIEPAAWFEVDFAGDYLDALRWVGDAPARRALRDFGRRHQRKILFCPGPVMVSEKVKRASVEIDVGHREKEFSNILWSVRKKLLRLSRAGRGHAVVMIPGSGTAANESVIAALPASSRVLVVSNGEFGERLAGLARTHRLRLAHVRRPWGAPIDWMQVRAAVRRFRSKVLLIVHHETSTGTVNGIAEARATLAGSRCELFVDCVSSFGGIPEDLSLADYATGSANKCLSSLPGLAFVVARTAALARIKSSRSTTLDLKAQWRMQEAVGQTVNTPPVSLFLALNAALDEIMGEGERHFARIQANGEIIRRSLGELGFSLHPFSNSPLLNNFLVPSWTTYDRVDEYLRGHGFLVYAGKGLLEGRIFQVANIGRITRRDIREFVRAFKRFVRENGPTVDTGVYNAGAGR
jgi:2-aminoethylphosphonate-pyruvate transaminase